MNEQCSNAGVDGRVSDFFKKNFKKLICCHRHIVLKEGGSAVDAAIASNLCISVINTVDVGKLLK